MSLIGWRQWAVDRRGRLRPAWTPWSPYPDDLLLWRADGLTRAHCLRSRRPPLDRPLLAGRPDAVFEARSAEVALPHPLVPDEGCVCGLYAWRTPSLLAAAPVPRWTRLPIVVGAVRLGGRVVVTERGYRAETACPVAVHDPDGAVGPDYRLARYRRFDTLVAEWDADGERARPEGDTP